MASQAAALDSDERLTAGHDLGSVWFEPRAAWPDHPRRERHHHTPRHPRWARAFCASTSRAGGHRWCTSWA